jgi:hypothetical protein
MAQRNSSSVRFDDQLINTASFPNFTSGEWDEPELTLRSPTNVTTVGSVATEVMASRSQPTASTNKLAQVVRRKVTTVVDFLEIESERRVRFELTALLALLQHRIRFVVNVDRTHAARHIANTKRAFMLECVGVTQKIGAWEVEWVGRGFGLFHDALEANEDVRRAALVNNETAIRSTFAGMAPASMRRQLNPTEWLGNVIAASADLAFTGSPLVAQGSPARALRAAGRTTAPGSVTAAEAGSPVGEAVNASVTALTLDSSIRDLLVEVTASMRSANPETAGGHRVFHSAADALADALINATFRATAAHIDGDGSAAVESTLLLSVISQQKAHMFCAAHHDMWVVGHRGLKELRQRMSEERHAADDAAAKMLAAKRRFTLATEMELVTLHCVVAIELQELTARGAIIDARRRVAGHDGWSTDGADAVLRCNVMVVDHIHTYIDLRQQAAKRRLLWACERLELDRRNAILGSSLWAPMAVKLQLHEIESRRRMASLEALHWQELTSRADLALLAEFAGRFELQRAGLVERIAQLRREQLTQPLDPRTDLPAELGHHEERHRLEMERQHRRQLAALYTKAGKEWKVLLKVMLERHAIVESNPLFSGGPYHNPLPRLE